MGPVPLPASLPQRVESAVVADASVGVRLDVAALGAGPVGEFRPSEGRLRMRTHDIRRRSAVSECLRDRSVFGQECGLWSEQVLTDHAGSLRGRQMADLRNGKNKDSPRTRQSPVTLATFPSWGSWPGWRHARSRQPSYQRFIAGCSRAVCHCACSIANDRGQRGLDRGWIVRNPCLTAGHHLRGPPFKDESRPEEAPNVVKETRTES